MVINMAGSKSVNKIQVSIEAVAAMLLLVMLAALTMLLIFSTGRGYKNIVNSGSTSQDIRTGLFFISTKVRQADSNGNINVVKSPFGGNALVISQTFGGNINEDWIFYYGGTLREVTIPKGTEINPTACAVISPLSSVSLTQAGNELKITVTKKSPDKSGGLATVSQSLVLTLRT
jgi:hypothetical protein